MTTNKKKFLFTSSGAIYSIPKSKWKKYLKLLLAHKLSLLKKKHLPIPELKREDVKLVAYNIFEVEKLKRDDCIDSVKSEIIKLGDKNEDVCDRWI